MSGQQGRSSSERNRRKKDLVFSGSHRFGRDRRGDQDLSHRTEQQATHLALAVSAFRLHN